MAEREGFSMLFREAERQLRPESEAFAENSMRKFWEETAAKKNMQSDCVD